MEFIKQLSNKKIAVIGLGYVGLPLACAFSKRVEVIGFDIDKEKIIELLEGKDWRMANNSIF